MFLRSMAQGLTLRQYETPPSNILDLGCGSGIWVIEAAKQDFDDTAEKLVDEFFEDEIALGELEGLFGACRAVCTGNLIWR